MEHKSYLASLDLTDELKQLLEIKILLLDISLMLGNICEYIDKDKNAYYVVRKYID